MSSLSRLTSRVLNLRTLAVVMLTALSCAPAAAQEGQTAARPDRGVNPDGAYAVSDVENISLQNGNVNLSIPLASLRPSRAASFRSRYGPTTTASSGTSSEKRRRTASRRSSTSSTTRS